MATKTSTWNKVTAPGALVVLTALFTGLFIAPTFEPARPRSLTLAHDPLRTLGRASGLITLDPLEQADQALAASGDKPWEIHAIGGSAGSADKRASAIDMARYECYSIERLVADLVHDLTPLREDPSKRLLVLLESMRGGALSEDHERRLRGRVATALALTREGLYPRHSKRLHMLCFDGIDEPAATQAAVPELGDSKFDGVIVPYEYFDVGPDSRSPYQSVAVCWINEAAVEDDPLKFGLQFARVLERTMTQAYDSEEKLAQRVDIRWLGPTTSGGLRAMQRSFGSLCEKCHKTNLKIVTPYATSPKLKPQVGAKWAAEGLSLQRSVNGDDVLARLLVNELMLRIPSLLPMHLETEHLCQHGDCPFCAASLAASEASPAFVRWLAFPLRILKFVPPPKKNERVRVALITELDSTYGQAWVQNMNDARDVLAGVPQAPGPHPQLSRIEFTVFPVFGWVDGILRESSDKKEASAATTIARDYPAEAHQLDYLHRLKDALQSEGTFSAIGIFVTEEYDTMMILEALRPHFPGVLFLTTDLDARYLQPRHAPFTRNLVVASHFGLTPEPENRDLEEMLPGDVHWTAPEFRDGYQTGVWHTVRALARKLEPLPPLAAHVYEIGRSRIVRLNTRAGALATPTPHGAVRALQSTRADDTPSNLELSARWFGARLLPAPVQAATKPHDTFAETDGLARGGHSGFVYIAAFCAVASLIFGLLVFATTPRRHDSTRWRASSRTFVGLAVIVVSLLAGLLLIAGVENVQQRYPAEPMFLLEGVSAWPTIALRGLIVLVCAFALVTIPARLRQAHAKIAADYRLDAKSPRASIRWVIDWAEFDGEEIPTPSTEKQPSLRRLSRSTWQRVSGIWNVFMCFLGRRPAKSMRSYTLDEVWAFVRDGVRARRNDLPQSKSRRETIRAAVFSWPYWTWARMFIYAFLLYFCLVPFFIFAGAPPNPVRGEFAYLVDRISLFAAIYSFMMVLMLVMETTFFASRLVARIVDRKAVVLSERFSKKADNHRERLLLVQKIASVVDPLIWSPMVVLGLMIIARASVFDSWPWPTVLMSVFALFLVMLLMCIVSLRSQCENAQRAAVRDLAILRDEHKSDEAASKRIAAIRDEIAALSGGAFSPLLHHPILGALMLPLAAFGANLAFERQLLERLLGVL